MLKALCHADPDPAIYLSAAPDPAFATGVGNYFLHFFFLFTEI
jgi:hypothetical protein